MNLKDALLKAAARKRAETPDVTDEQHQETIDLIRGGTLEMSFRIHGLPKSRKIGGAMADTMANSIGGKRKGVRSSWSMFTSEHPQVKALNQAIRDLEHIRDAWTIVKSAEVKKGEGGVTIEGGKRLIWDKDIPDFYSAFVQAAERIDREVEKLQYAMDNVTYDADNNEVKSVKDMDRENAGGAWDEGSYPKDLRLVVGVAKVRDGNGLVVEGDDGKPQYIINFEEYHVSEKLPKLLRERALQRIDEGLSGTIETAMGYAVNELTESMVTFLGELTNRMKIYPKTGSPYHYMVAHGEAEIVKLVKPGDDAKVPAGHVKALVRYPAKEGEDGPVVKISKWVGPIKEAEFATQMKPETTGERKKIYPSVIEGIVEQLQTFRDKKSKMLGVYGENTVAAFAPLLELLTKAKESNPYETNNGSAVKLAAVLKSNADVRGLMSSAVADTVAALEEHVAAVKETHRRRSVKASLIGQV